MNKFISIIYSRTDAHRAHKLFSGLNNKYVIKQSPPLKVKGKEVTDKTKTACTFNIFYLAQHKLKQILKKREKTHRNLKSAEDFDCGKSL